MRRRRPRSRSDRPPVGLLEVLAQEPDGGGTRDVGSAQDVAVLASLRHFGRLPDEAQAAARPGRQGRQLAARRVGGTRLHREVSAGADVGFERVELT